MKNRSGLFLTAGSSSRSVILSVAMLALVGSVAVPAAFGQCSAPPTIVIQPQSQTVLNGDLVTFSVRATFSSACPTTYNWQFRLAGDTNWFDIGGFNLPDFTYIWSRGNNGTAFRCIVANAFGSVTSSVATLTTTLGTCTAAPAITVEPQDTTVNEGQAITLSVQIATPPAGCATKYTWRFLESADHGEVAIPGATNASYTFIPNRDNQYWTYDVLVENAAGITKSRETFINLIHAGTVSREAESLTRTSSGASTALQNDPNTSGGKWVALLANSVGDSVSYTIPNVQPGTYQVRFRHKVNNNRGIANVTLGGISLGQIDQYLPIEGYPTEFLRDVTFTTAGNKILKMTVAGKNVNSSAFTLSADHIVLEPGGSLNCTTPPVITKQPQNNITVLEGNPVSIYVEANATPSACQLTYQWRYLASADHSEEPIPGEFMPWITILPTRDNEDFEYDVLITNAAGSTESQKVRFNVIRSGSLFYEAESVSRTSTGASTALQNDPLTSGGKWVALLADGVGDTVSYTLPNVPAGEYNLKMKYKMNGNRGILDILVDGAVASQAIDQYAPAPFYVETFFNQGFFNTTGSHVFKLRTLGKNTAADAFTLSADQFTLAPR